MLLAKVETFGRNDGVADGPENTLAIVSQSVSQSVSHGIVCCRACLGPAENKYAAAAAAQRIQKRFTRLPTEDGLGRDY